MEIRDVIVSFEKWCESCLHFEKAMVEDPCNDCLAEVYNTDSDKPVLWKQKDLY